MKWFVVLGATILHTGIAVAQDGPTTDDPRLELRAENTETAGDDDELPQQLSWLKKHPLDLNKCTAEELALPGLLNEMQINQLLQYRALLGKLVNKYELQAVPTWDIATIRSMLPYIFIDDAAAGDVPISERWQDGDRRLQLRTAFTAQRAAGYLSSGDTVPPRYPGSRMGLLARYSYNFKNLLRWGITGEKDPGEQFFRGAQKAGFDFYGFHFFLRNTGIVKAFAAGDFTFNLSQGLVNWQTMAFTKSGDAMAIKRQGPVVRPYTAAGEYNFYRGLAITIGRHYWEHSFFLSARKLDGGAAEDSSGNITGTSISTSGLHRSATENQHRGETSLYSAGVRLQWHANNLRWGVHSVFHRFSSIAAKAERPYQLFADSRRVWLNAAIDASYTWRNFHLFSELAFDRGGNPALVAGAMLSVAARVSCSFLYRNIAAAYHSLHGDAFTANSSPGNENGMYMGVHVQLSPFSSVDAWADIFRFPWLTYSADAPSAGMDAMIRWIYAPLKTTSLSVQYRAKNRMQHITGFNGIYPYASQQIRLQLSMSVSKQLTLVNRAEWVHDTKPGDGYLIFSDFRYTTVQRNRSIAARFQYFETDGFDQRIYALEQYLPYNYAVPFYYGKGFHGVFSFNQRFNIHKAALPHFFSRLELGISCGLTLVPGAGTIGSGDDRMPGRSRTDWRFQVIVNN
jgi:hypothetical protein